MKNRRFPKSKHPLFHCLFVLILFLFSCQNQNSHSIKKIALAKENSFDTKDQLFYIEGQLCQHLRTIFQDSKDQLWFGTNVYDLMLYNGDSLVYISEEDGLASGRITKILENKDGHIWISSYSGMSKFDGKSFTNFKENNKDFSNDIWDFFIDREGLFWLATTEGVRLFDGQEFKPFDIPKAIVKDSSSIYAYDRISSILQDKNGTIWFGTDGFGICRYNGTNFDFITTENGLPSNCIGSLMEDSKGNIWIATMFGGISKYDGKKFNNYTAMGMVQGAEVGALYEDHNGNIWFAAENHGVYSYDGKSFKNYGQEHGLNTNGILSIFRDRQDRFWFGGWGGLFRFDGQKFVSITRQGPWK